MKAYSGFAEVYDLFMDNVPYESWSEYIAGILRDYGAESGILLEIGRASCRERVSSRV